MRIFGVRSGSRGAEKAKYKTVDNFAVKIATTSSKSQIHHELLASYPSYVQLPLHYKTKGSNKETA